jgi:hypothetical protein
VYDINNYDINSFDIGEGHQCSGTEIEINQVKCKIVKIQNRRGYPNFQFEIEGKMYFYGIRGIRKDYKIILRCTKQFSGKSCKNNSYIAPLDLLKQIMQDNKSSKKKYSKILDNSDPRVYDSKNYDVNSFDIGEGHKCSETEIKKNSKFNKKPENEMNDVKCKLVQIVNHVGRPNFHFEIDGKMYVYGIRGIRSDYKIILRCTKRACYYLAFIAPLDLLKQIMQEKSPKKNYLKMLDTSDPRVYDLKNYDLNSFDIGKGHKCHGDGISLYLQNQES